MKVVLFCGGQGMRLRDYSEAIPKPMVNIGYRPILWHVMKYYAHFGHKDFILCLGYKADVIKKYFRDYDESVSNDFILSSGGELQLLSSDIQDWNITFIDTGMNASIGERLKAIEPFVEGEEVFMANYSDGLTDLNLDSYVGEARSRQAVGSFLSVRPTMTFHVVSSDGSGLVRGVQPVTESDIWINAGFFVFRREIFDHLRQGEDLVFEPFQRLIALDRLYAHKYSGFWTAMDTFKDRDRLDGMYATGHAPWEVWKTHPGVGAR